MSASVHVRYASGNKYHHLDNLTSDSRDSSYYNQSSTSSATTIDAVREVRCKSNKKEHCCEERNPNPPQCYPYPYPYSPMDYNNPGGEKFQSIITPVTNLTPQYSGVSGTVQFLMRRKNKTVTLQWEPFNGIMAASGTPFLTVAQSISNLPPYPITRPIKIKYKDTIRSTSITIDPHTNNGNILFSLNSDDTGNDINMGDSFSVFGGSLEWIVQ